MHRRTRQTLRTIARRCLLAFALLLTLRLLWGLESSYRLARVQDQLRAQGVTLPFQPVRAPDDKNAYADLARAARLVRLSSTEYTLLFGDFRTGEPVWTPAEMPALQAIVDRHRDAFLCIDAAAQRTGHIPTADPNYGYNLQNWEHLGRMLVADAVLQRAQGHETAILQDLQRLVVLADTIDRGGYLVANRTANNLRSMLAGSVERLAPTLRLSHSDDSRPAALALLKSLQDPAPRASLAWNFSVETSRMPEFSTHHIRLRTWWLYPLRDDDLARAMSLAAGNLPAMRAPDWPAAKRLFVGEPTPPKLPFTNLHNLTFWYVRNPTFCAWTMLEHFYTQSDLRAAAILLAARLYEVDNRQAPANIADLVPGFLPAAPLDPFSPTGAAMHFRLDEEGPTVWSVGENAVDDGAPVQAGRPRRLNTYNRLVPPSLPDIVYGAAWLNANPPPASTATTPVPRRQNAR
jgi:hypothetical protein